MEKTKYNFKQISNSRNVIMGIATILILIFHSQTLYLHKIFNSNIIQNLITFFRDTGNVGVDIFLILSGLGLYYSFSKDSNIKNFYKKRLLRILPATIIVAIFTTVLMEGSGFGYFLRRITLLTLFTGEDVDFWYFSLIIILYLLYPLFHKVIKKFDSKGIIMLIVPILIINHCIRVFDITLYKNIEIAITRIPVFIAGIYLGKKSSEGFKIDKKILIPILLLLSIMILLLYIGTFKKCAFVIRYVYFFISIPIVILLSFIIKNNDNIFERFLIDIGKYSMEIYLIYEYLVKNCVNLFVYHDKYNLAYYIAVIILTFILAHVLKQISNNISSKLVKNK